MKTLLLAVLVAFALPVFATEHNAPAAQPAHDTAAPATEKTGSEAAAPTEQKKKKTEKKKKGAHGGDHATEEKAH